MNVLETIRSEEFGLEALIGDGNARGAFRAVLRDTDCDETIRVIFHDDLDALRAKAREFVDGIAPAGISIPV